MLSASLHAASRATSLLTFRLFLRPNLKFWSIGGYADEDHLGKSFRAKDFGLECLAWRNNGFREFYTSDWFPYVWALP